MKIRAKSRDQTGSVLIVAMLLCAIIGLSLVSYYNLASSTLKGATRSFLSMSNVDLAEIGIENAMACFYDQSTGTASATAWSGWTLSGATATRTFSGYTPAPNTTSVVRVYVNNYTNTGGAPVIVAKATSTPPDGPPIDKFVEVTLRSRTVTPAGIIARTNVTGDSNLYVDSWDSSTSIAGTLYSTSVRNANGSLGVTASGNGALNVGDNPVIYGTVKTGGGTVSKTGSARLSSTIGVSGWDTTLWANDFAYTFPAVTVPTPTVTNSISVNVTTNITFPRAGDVAASDGKYYYQFSDKIINYASDTMTISGKCVFLMTGHAATTNSITTSSSSNWTYGNSTATLEIYTSGSIYFDSGANWFTNGVPSRCTINMTASSGAQFHTGGGGSWNAVIYGPNAAFNIDSGGNFCGSMIMLSCVLRGGVNFHYDEALGASGGGGSGASVTKWKELQSASERAAYSSALNF